MPIGVVTMQALWWPDAQKAPDLVLGATMRFGYFFTMYALDGEPYERVLERAISEVKFADGNGFDAIWMGEHHFGGDGYDVHPNPLMTGAYLAAVTEQVRIGLAAAIVPNWHP